MNDKLKTAIEALAEKAQAAEKPHEAMQLAQAALNLAQAGGVMKAASV